jgi:hypothetical protein
VTLKNMFICVPFKYFRAFRDLTFPSAVELYLLCAIILSNKNLRISIILPIFAPKKQNNNYVYS